MEGSETDRSADGPMGVTLWLCPSVGGKAKPACPGRYLFGGMLAIDWSLFLGPGCTKSTC